MNHRHLFYFSCALILLITSLAAKLEAQTSAEADFFDEAPLILTASRMSKPLDESPASVSIIDRRMIEASGAREIADLFRLVPGFIVGHFNGDKPVVTYNGFGDEFARKIQVLVDGRSVIAPSFGGVPWSNLPLSLEDIERIEVIRGPNAVTYGANAFLATINIITRHAAEDFGARYSITASDNSNPDIKDAFLRLGFHRNDLDWRLSAGTSDDDGFANVEDSRDIDKVNFRLDYLSSSEQSWSIQLGRSDSTHGRGFAGNAFNIPRKADATNNYLNLLWERNMSETVSSIRLTHTEQEVIDSFFADDGMGITAVIDFGRLSRRSELELIQSRELAENIRLVYGGSQRKDRVKSIFLLNDLNFHDIDTSRLFTALEWRLDQNWLFDLGITLEDTNMTERESSPRLSIIRKLNPDHAVRFVASRAKRHPILYELNGLTLFSADVLGAPVDIQTWQGNPNIQPEDIVSYEFGLRSDLSDSGVSSDIKLFTYRISDQIVIVDSGLLNPLLQPIRTNVNLGDNRVEGIELALDYSPTPGLEIKSGFSFINAESTDQGIEDSFPDRTAFFNADYRWQERHRFSASLYYIDEMRWLGGDMIKPIRKLDLRYAYIIDQRSETRIELIGQNLLEDYNDYFSENLVEKVFLLRISGGF